MGRRATTSEALPAPEMPTIWSWSSTLKVSLSCLIVEISFNQRNLSFCKRKNLTHAAPFTVADKSDCPPSPPSHWGAKAHQPDLGFVDCSDSASSSSSLPYSSSSSSSPYSSQLDCHISSSLARLSSLSSSSSLLGKQLKVQLEKLPMPVVQRGERKRTLLSSTSSVPGKKRKSHVTAGLFNTFRISKPPPSSLVQQEAKINFSEQQKQRRLRDIEEPVRTSASDDCSLVGAEPGISDCTNATSSECSTPLLLASDESRGSAEPDAVERDPTDASFVLPRKLRFPVSSSSSPSGITCKWEGCLQGFKTHGKLSDHIKVPTSFTISL